MASNTFDILAPAQWSDEQKATIVKYFKGKQTEWTKKTLSPIRKELRSSLLKLQNYTCAYCRRALSHEIGRNEIDHIIAKAIDDMARFTYERMNLVAICKRCNKNKSDKPVLAVSLTDACAYPLKSTDYFWVHPYIHKYSEHIRIHESYIFEAMGDKHTKRRAQALIDACQLSSMPEVEKRRALESISQSAEVYLAILTAIGQFSHIADEELAETLKATRVELVDLSVQAILGLVTGIRSASLALIEKSINLNMKII